MVPAIRAQGYEPLLVPLGPPDRVNGYPAALRALFFAEVDFCVVEHDIESTPGALGALDSCPEPWCWHAYDLDIEWERSGMDKPHFAMLGHTRFRAGLGDVLAPLLSSERWFDHWDGRDRLLVMALEQAGHRPHRHHPKVLHHHDYA